MSEDRSVERLSVAEAAEALGVTRDAIHKRINRDTITHEKGEDGRLYVYVDTAATTADKSVDKSKDESKVEVLERYIARLEHELEQAADRDRENRRIIAMLTSRIPQLEAPSEARESPETVEEAPDRAESPTPPRQGLRVVHRGRGGEEYLAGRRSMQDDRTAQDAKRLLVAFRNNHEEAKMVSPEGRRTSPFGTTRAFVPHWSDAEQAGLNRVRRDDAMRWLVEKDMLKRDEEAENSLGIGEGFPDYDFGSVFRITDSGRELLEEIRQERGQR